MTADSFRRAFCRDLETAAREVEAYPSDESLWARIPGLTNSGGTLARHLAGNMRHFVGHLLGGSGYLRDREAEFSGAPMPRPAVAAELRAAIVEVDAAMRALDDAALQAPFATKIANVQLSTELALVHLTAHFGYHLGQIDFHRRVQDPDAQPVGAMTLDPLA